MTFELTAAALLLFGAFYGTPVGALREKLSPVLPERPAQVIPIDRPITIEHYVREYFKDVPVMAEIARCESRFRQFDKSGKVLRGEVAVEDVGVMQINEFYHGDVAEKLGFDLHTLDGNLAYARWLYSREGFTPWAPSARCWQNSETLARVNLRLNLD